MPKPLIGAHVSASGGLFTCFKRASDIGAEAIQIFGASPRQWRVKLPDADIVSEFHKEHKVYNNMPVYLHAAYLVNLATPKEDLWQKSVDNLAAHFTIANMLGAKGLVFHLGSFKGWTKEEGLENMVKGMHAVLKKVPEGPSYLIMENSSGGGDKIGGDISDIGVLFEKVNSDRVKVCLDTQHAYAAGAISDYNEANIKSFIANCDKAFGWDAVDVLHLNDSKTENGSCVDRHENIGEGLIGLNGFQLLAKQEKAQKIPWVLEVPGFDGEGPDKKNIDKVKSLFS